MIIVLSSIKELRANWALAANDNRVPKAEYCPHHNCPLTWCLDCGRPKPTVKSWERYPE